ncbi:hypothetical protein ASG31_10270 [Chryseobacterium sp. Leaf404]|uniref:M4 family metallopeptidase n=1 Tax=unclassified Chryseobacterium TaxID=2593645 RepID=UPI0007015340|nr:MULTISPECIES: M4 family metallopeptidase [unclassified Chryseobacterium]KQT16757.1 hypothetical protein ASG31_10270 [Chryseobacterium sp. Leaf404]
MKKTNTLFKNLVIVLSLNVAAVNFFYAQDNRSVRDFPAFTVTPNSPYGNFHVSFEGKNVSSSSLASSLGKWLGGTADDTFQVVKSWRDELGIKKTVYQHFYKNLKVQDDIIISHEKDGIVMSVNGEFVNNIAVSIDNALSAENLKTLIATDSKIPADKLHLSDIENVIVKVDTGNGAALHNASKVEGYSFSPMTSKVYYVDNSSKKIIKSFSLIHHVDTPSTSATYYKGNQSITVDSNDGVYRLKNNAKKVWTVDATNLDTSTVNSIATTTDGFKFFANTDAVTGLSTTYNTDYTNPTANFTGASSKTAVEVHWSIGASNDYYLARLNRNSFDGLGTPIVSYNNFNFGTAASPNGTNATAITLGGSRFMAFGNGALPLFNPFVGIDVGGHEYSHLVVGTNGTGGLTYQAESGALNEGFADMLGASIEFFASPSQANWTIGEGLMNPGTYTTGGANPQTIVVDVNYLRSMSNPKSATTLTGKQPDTYGGTYWIVPTPPYNQNNDQGGVHVNSGVANKWFYLLSVGGSGTNDLGTNYNVTGITILKAEKIAYKTLTGGYLTPNSNFAAAYAASKQAAISLYGAGSNELQQVENAWCAVGVGNCLSTLSTNDNTLTNAKGIKIYPNPISNGQFTIEYDLKGSAEYEIYDFSGKIVLAKQKLERGINKVSLPGISSGVYLIKINGDETNITKKIIVK